MNFHKVVFLGTRKKITNSVNKNLNALNTLSLNYHSVNKAQKLRNID